MGSDKHAEARKLLEDGILRAKIENYGTDSMKALLASWDEYERGSPRTNDGIQG